MAVSKVTVSREVTGRHRFLVVKKGRGNGKAMSFIHGASGYGEYFLPMMKFFASVGFVCYAPDIRGHGARSEEDIRKASVLHYYKDVARFHREVIARRHRQKPVIVGHSMGGLIALMLAAGNYAARTIAIVPSPPKGVRYRPNSPYMTPEVYGLVRNMLEFVALFLSRMALSREFIEHVFVDPVASKAVIDDWQMQRVAESRRALSEMSNSRLAVDPEKVTTPLLLVGARKDVLVHPDISQEIADLYDADHVMLEGSGHMCPFESGWEATAKAMLLWLESRTK